MAVRMTVAALEFSGFDFSQMVINVLYLVRKDRVTCRVELSGLGAQIIQLCDSKGAVRYWATVGYALADIAKTIKYAAGNYKIEVTGGALLFKPVVESNYQKSLRISGALADNGENQDYIEAQVAIMTDAPAALDCLAAEAAILQAAKAAL